MRSLSKSPGFLVMAVVTLALGIAASTALFSVVYAVLLQPLAFPDSGRVVAINTAWPTKNQSTARMTGGDFVDLRPELRDFAALTFYFGGDIGLRLRNNARFAQTFIVNPDFFQVLEVQPSLGRLPTKADARQTAVVTASFARANFADAAAAIGESVVMDNKPYQVVGVLQDKLAFPEQAQVWIVGATDPDNLNRTAFNYFSIGRVRPGVSLRQAQAELTTVASRSAAAHPESNEGKTFRLQSLQEQLGSPVRATLLFLFAAAGLLLLISCANVANLMLTRAATRSHEMAVRASLGSSRLQIVRLLLGEGALIGAGAAIVGLALSYLAVRALLPLMPQSVPHAADVLNLRVTVLLFAAGASGLTALACSLIPALQLPRFNLANVLKQAPSRGFVRGGSRSRGVIVVLQVAMCCMLCVGAALLARTLLALTNTSLGVRSEGILVMYADEPATGLPEYQRAIRTFETALEDIRHIPGVRSAAAVMGMPTGQYGSDGSYLVEGVHIKPGQDLFKMNWPHNLPHAVFALASPQYFRTLGIRLLAGRDFSEKDQYEAPFTAVISQSLARQSFGMSDPIGQRIYCGLDSPNPMTIVGVVSDVRQDSPASQMEPEIYMPFQQHPFMANELQIAVRVDGDPRRLIPEVRNRMGHIAPYMATRFTTFNEMVEDSIAAPRFRAALALAFAILAIGLAMTGVYGIMTYYVTERRAEMGVRIALGASASSIIGLISGRALTLAVAGLCLGLGGAIAVSRLLASLLFGIQAVDAWTYCIGAGVVLALVLLASSIPAWRASRVDPVVVLRSE